MSTLPSFRAGFFGTFACRRSECQVIWGTFSSRRFWKSGFFCDLALKSRFLDIFAKNFGSWSKVPLVIRFSNLGTQSCFRVIDYGIQSRFWDVDIQSRFWYIDIQSHFVGSSSACHFLLIKCLLVLIVQADSASWVKPACRLCLAQSVFCLISIAFVIFSFNFLEIVLGPRRHLGMLS